MDFLENNDDTIPLNRLIQNRFSAILMIKNTVLLIFSIIRLYYKILITITPISLMLTNDELSILLSRTPHKINASFFHESPSSQLSDDELSWHEQHIDIHSTREAMLVLDGSVNQRLNSEFFECTPGTLVLFNHNEPHDKGYYPEVRGVFLWIFLHIDGFLATLTENTESGLVTRDNIQFSSRDVMDRLTNVWDVLEHDAVNTETKSSYIIELEALFNILFVEASRKFSQPHEKARRQGDSMDAQGKIDLIKNYIREHSGQKSDIKTLARYASISESHFYRLFKQHAGCTVKQYMDVVREEKYLLLSNRKRPRKEIAYELGFSSTEALCHWLKRKK